MKPAPPVIRMVCITDAEWQLDLLVKFCEQVSTLMWFRSVGRRTDYCLITNPVSYHLDLIELSLYLAQIAQIAWRILLNDTKSR